jgi:hypothetical protein
MKRWMLLVLFVALLASGAALAQDATPEPTAEPTTAPTLEVIGEPTVTIIAPTEEPTPEVTVIAEPTIGLIEAQPTPEGTAEASAVDVPPSSSPDVSWRLSILILVLGVGAVSFIGGMLLWRRAVGQETPE